MTATTPGAGDRFPDVELPDHTGAPVRLSSLTRPSALDRRLGFDDGYPLVLVFYRGWFCPRDYEQMRQLVAFQDELRVSYAKLAAVSVDPPAVAAAYRAGLGARWPFLSDEDRSMTRALDILDETEGEHAWPAQPHTFVLRPDLTVHRVYPGWFFVGRPTDGELRRDLREVMESFSNYRYEAWTAEAVERVRIPQQVWAEGAPDVGSSGLPVAEGVVIDFDRGGGNGTIRSDDGEEVFFNFHRHPRLGLPHPPGRRRGALRGGGQPPGAHRPQRPDRHVTSARRPAWRLVTAPSASSERMASASVSSGGRSATPSSSTMARSSVSTQRVKRVMASAVRTESTGVTRMTASITRPKPRKLTAGSGRTGKARPVSRR